MFVFLVSSSISQNSVADSHSPEHRKSASSKKKWHLYTLKFLEVRAKVHFSDNTHIKSVHNFLRSAKDFSKQLRVYLTKNTIARDRKITRVTGRIVFIHRSYGFEFFRRPCQTTGTRYVLLFHVEKAFTLNLTAADLVTGRGSLDCLESNLTVFMYQFYRDLVFCGHYSRLKIYPPFRAVEIVVYKKERTIVLFKADFSVTDKHQIVTYQCEMFKPTILYPALHYISSPQSSVHIMVVSRKSERIICSFLQQKQHSIQRFVLYNGPGELSPNIKGTRNVFKSSAFQALIVISLFNKSLTSLNITFQFCPAQITKVIHLNLTQELKLPGETCTRNPCIISLFVDKGKHAKVTIDEILYSPNISYRTGNRRDYSSVVCKYAGLLTFENTWEKSFESFTVCSSYIKENPTVVRNFYSQGSSLCLMLYWFDPYGHLNATLTMSSTGCKVIPFHFCELYFNDTEQILQKVAFKTGVLQGLRHVDTIWPAMMPWENHHRKRELILSFQENECIIIQMYERTFSNADALHQHSYQYYYPCEVALIPMFVRPKKESLLHVRVEGHLESNEYNFCVFKHHMAFSTRPAFESVSSLLRYKMRKSVLNFTQQGKWQQLNNTPFSAMQFHRAWGRPRRVYEPHWRHHLSRAVSILNVDYFVYDVHFNEFFSEEQIFLDVHLYPRTQSWVEIVFRTVSINSSADQPRPCDLSLEACKNADSSLTKHTDIQIRDEVPVPPCSHLHSYITIKQCLQVNLLSYIFFLVKFIAKCVSGQSLVLLLQNLFLFVVTDRETLGQYASSYVLSLQVERNKCDLTEPFAIVTKVFAGFMSLPKLCVPYYVSTAAPFDNTILVTSFHKGVSFRLVWFIDEAETSSWSVSQSVISSQSVSFYTTPLITLYFIHYRRATWNEASFHCRNLHSNLPFFTSKRHFDECLSIIKSHLSGLYVGNIFINLKLFQRKVRLHCQVFFVPTANKLSMVSV